MHPLPSTETAKEHIGNRSGRVFLAALMLLACFYPSPARAQEAEKDRQKAHRTAPPDGDAGLIGLIPPARRAKPAAALVNEGDSVAPGAAYINPAGAGTINNRAGSLSLGTGSTSAPAQFSGRSRPPSMPDNWLGGSGNWSDGSKWSNGVPTIDGKTDVFIDNGNPKNSMVNLDTHAVINTLTIDTDDSLNITNGNTLSVNGPTVANAGIISLNATSSGASLNFNAASATLSGGGQVLMSDNSGNSIGAKTLTVQETIAGSGSIIATSLNNSATINAFQSNPLILGATTVTNTGAIEATMGGTLIINSGTYTNTGGVIQDNASTLILENSVTINGGMVTQAGNGTIKLEGGTVINAPVLNSSGGTFEVTGIGGNNTISGKLTNPTGGEVKIDAGGFLTITNPTISNAGTFSMNATTSSVELRIGAPNVTLTGGGSLTMSISANNVISGSSPSNILTNQETISGSGNIGLGSMALVNSSIINANQPTPLVLEISNGATNTGELEATNGGILTILGGTYNNTAGLILNNGSFLNITQATINGGTVNQPDAGLLQLGGATINAPVSAAGPGTVEVVANLGVTTIGGTLTNAAGSQVKIDNGGSLTITASTISNAGTISMNSSGGDTRLTIGAPNVTLTGGGTLTMSNNGSNAITGSAPGNFLINQETIQGSGNIGLNFMSLNNSGTINANQATPLSLQISSTTTAINTGTIEATNGGNLFIVGGTYNNTGGKIVNNGGTIQIGAGAIIDGGTVSLTGAGTTQLSGNSTINAPVTNSSTGTIEVPGFNGSGTFGGTLTNPLGGQIKIDNGGTLILTAPTISNSGMIWMNSTGSTTELEIGAPKVTFSGKGILMMSNNPNNIITALAPADLFINQGTIEGAGNIGNNFMGLLNKGTIVANNGTMTIFPSGSSNFTNSGKLTVTSGNTLSFIGSTSNSFTTSGTVNVNSGGNLTFQVGQASYVQTKGSTTVDGNLTSANGINISGGTVYGNLGTLAGNFNLSGTGAINPGDGIKKVGELTINGAYTQASTASALIDLGGTASGKFDVLNVTNSASLNGKLIVDLVNGFKPVAGNSFDIMNYASESGMFSSETLPVIVGDHWLVTIGATDVLLQLLAGPGATREQGGTFAPAAGDAGFADGVGFTDNVPPSALPPTSQFDSSGFSNGQPTQTPEPSGLLLLGSALLGMGALARRHLKKRAAKS